MAGREPRWRTDLGFWLKGMRTKAELARAICSDWKQEPRSRGKLLHECSLRSMRCQSPSSFRSALELARITLKARHPEKK